MGARASRPQSRAQARRARALAISHKGRGDPPAAICTWFRMVGLAAALWIPAFAGMTVGNAGMTGEKSGMTERGRPARTAALARATTRRRWR